ncbi:MAG: stage 0 sporulation protein [Candidatus Omnitrophica bacterium]|nr:stage 0 sporulation protein [Candidatus Omnitrophota bacterium]
MGKIVQIQVGEYRQVYWFDAAEVVCRRDDIVIIEYERSLEFGRVVSDPDKVCKGKTEASVGRIIRLASEGDLKQIETNRQKAKDSINACLRKINDQKLEMRIIKGEYSFDNSKILFFFSSDGRVDFRNLVKELARILRARIELKQIQVRDKAKIIGGFGVCGRELCCSSYMTSFHPLSIKMAKEQGLPLNPSKISGVCGRIKCCMAYEYNVYREMARSLPRMGQKVSTQEGKGKVIAINVLKKFVHVDYGEGKIIKHDYSTTAMQPTKLASADAAQSRQEE